MIRHIRKTRRGLFALAAGVFAAAAAAQEPDRPSIVVGTTVTNAGHHAYAAREHQQGLRLWADEVNARSGLLGHTVRLAFESDNADAESVAAAFEKIIVEHKAQLLVSPYAAETTPAAAAVTERHALPLIVATGADLWDRGHKNVFGLLTPASVFMDPVIEFARRKGLRRVALVYQREGFPLALAQGVKRRLTGAGMRLVLDAAYPPEQLNFAGVIERLKNKRPDMVIVGSYLPDAVAFMQQAKAQMYSAPVLAFSGGANLPDFGEKLRTDAEGVIGMTQWESDLNLISVTEFTRRYRERFGYDPGFVAAASYAAGQVLEAAVKRAGTLELESLRKALRELDMTTVLGRYKVDANGEPVGKTSYAIQWINGARVSVLPSVAARGEPIYPFQDWSRR